MLLSKIIFNEAEIADIIKKYLQGMSSRKIANEYKVDKSVILRYLRLYNIEIKQDNHRYKANYNYFNSIDSKEKAYWLGFIAADGCNYIRNENATIILNIHQKDIEHLEKFKDCIQSNAKIVEYRQSSGFSNNTLMCKISINSKIMSNDLKNLGIVPNKSLILKPPLIEEEYYKSFISGYFDGDGCISISNNIFSISFEGTKEMLSWIKEILNWDATLHKRYPDNKNNYFIRCGGNNKLYYLMKQFYEDSPIHLNRKFEKYKELEKVVLNKNIK